MPNACCVPNCDSGYSSCKDKKKAALFRFPKDGSMRDKWFAAIPRKNWVLTENHRVCAKHFLADDFQAFSTDHRENRRAQRSTQKLKQKRLKAAVIPHVFPGLPMYLSSTSVQNRGLSCTVSCRLEKENERREKENAEFLATDEIQDFVSLKKDLHEVTLPAGYIVKTEEKKISFHCIKENNIGIQFAPNLLASVVVCDNLTVSAFASSARIPQSSYQHFLNQKQIKSFSGLSNLLAYSKSLADKSTYHDTIFIDLAIASLKDYIEARNNHGDVILHLALLLFIIEELQLLFKPKEGRRYSTTMITTAFLWQLTSSSLYKKLKDIFILPSMSRLRAYSSGLAVESGSLDISYLNQRLADLTKQEKLMTLMIDEVYTARCIEYRNGAFIGITEDGIPAKTVLTFMIHSSFSKYQDVVCLVPVDKLDTKTLYFWFNKVMHALHDLVTVVAVSVDNHVCNRYVVLLPIVF